MGRVDFVLVACLLGCAVIASPAEGGAQPGGGPAAIPSPVAATTAPQATTSAATPWTGYLGTIHGTVQRMLAAAGQTMHVDPILTLPGPTPGGPTSRSGRGDSTATTPPGGLPTQLWFGPATPNPSRAGVSFRVDLPRPADVRLLIVDVSGRRVGEVHEWREAGRHVLALGASRARPAGVYYARLDVDGRTLGVRRLVVLR